MSSIWNSVEAMAWGEHLTFEDYLKLHQESKVAGDPLDHEGYRIICVALWGIYNHEIKEGTLDED